MQINFVWTIGDILFLVVLATALLWAAAVAAKYWWERLIEWTKQQSKRKEK